MPTVKFICLANSYKNRARCVAGIRTDNGAWIRPIGARDDGALTTVETTCTNGAQPQLLDILRVQLGAPCPQPHQPENWSCSGGAGCRWEWVRRASDDELRALRDQAVSHGLVFGTNGDRIAHADLMEKPIAASLVLLSPKRLRWKVARRVADGPLKCRVTFVLDEHIYDLAVTDPVWHAKMLAAGEGEHRPKEFGGGRKGGKTLLVISLGEPSPHDDYCYKLVTGVFLVPWDSPPTSPQDRSQDSGHWSDYATSVRADSPNAYNPWTDEEEKRLTELHRNGMSIADLAQALGRQRGGIKSRLRKLGLID